MNRKCDMTFFKFVESVVFVRDWGVQLNEGCGWPILNVLSYSGAIW